MRVRDWVRRKYEESKTVSNDKLIYDYLVKVVDYKILR